MTGTESKFKPTPEGITTVIWQADKADLQRELSRNPAGVIASKLTLSKADQRLLDGMDARDLAELVKPIVDALETGKPFRVLEIDRGGATKGQATAALKKCTITITFEF